MAVSNCSSDGEPDPNLTISLLPEGIGAIKEVPSESPQSCNLGLAVKTPCEEFPLLAGVISLDE